MRPPLIEMVIRTPELDLSRYPNLPHLRTGFGGTFGVGVRPYGKHHNHAGWDLYAKPGTFAFAIARGKVVETRRMHGYGNSLLLEFEFRGKALFALYAHLQHALVHPGKTDPTPVVGEGVPIAQTGTDGNAGGEPPHLHFEIWTRRDALGLPFPTGRISPGEVLGYHYDNMDNRILGRMDRA
jgi:murein DD-endopeptidase MepM/ murein hydrolase activator NlpD